jgi:pimeloyl-ACP methyl ester carboxylesterase
MTASIEAWWAAGEGAELELSGTRRRIFVRRIEGPGSHVTLLHGFPSSSHDWAKIAPALSARAALLLPDFLGFGASEKPQDHEYSIHEQADLVAALWERYGVAETTVVAHDYAVSVVQELLARAHPAIRGVVFLNGGLYPDLHRPQPIQTALLDPEQGPKIGPNLTEELLLAGAEPTFAPGYDRAADVTAIWRSIAREDGQLILHRLIRYMVDRREHEERWVDALEHTSAPKAFVWGMLDPISGAHIAQRLRERLPDAPLTALEDVGHWPPLEAPDRVVESIIRVLA